jgi:tyrosine decarboxylase/aspartate 1-decarboxylase
MKRSQGNGLEKESLAVLARALDRLDAGFADLPAFESETAVGPGFEEVLMEVAGRLREDYPYFHPLYAGQMLKPPHPVARAAYALAMWINPNNHALDVSKASSAMEKEAVAEIARMVGWDTHLGHLCGGGTMANLEALWVSGQLHPGSVVLASQQAHYTHERISNVLGLRFEAVACDRRGRIDLEALEKRLQRGDVGIVVATIGSTATGAVDSLPDLLEMRKRYPFRLHADAAYGGYFRLVDNLSPETAMTYYLLDKVDSIVIDPHKHGLQPYGCGCVLFRDPSVGRFYKHDSPYTYFTSGDLHLGEISLECSRPGATAVGLWATQRLLPLARGGRFAAGLERSRRGALSFCDRLISDRRFAVPFPPELDIVVWTVRTPFASRSSELARLVFEEAACIGLHLALVDVPVHFFRTEFDESWQDKSTVTCLRSALMKPEHEAWVDRIYEMLGRSASAVIRG